MPTVRTFIAVDLPSPVQEALGRCQEGLGAAGKPYVKWVEPQGIHLTLKFLGNLEEAMLPRLAEALAPAVARVPPFQLRLAALGAFPDPGNPRVLWVGLAGDLKELLCLYSSVEEALTPLGFPREQRPFAPHLTLGRVREAASREEKRHLEQALAETQTDTEKSILIEEVHIMKSELSRWGARYASLYRLSLRKVARY